MRKNLNPDSNSPHYTAFFEDSKCGAAPAFVGVTSTGIFCRRRCPARQPKPENCAFFETAQGALSSGFRACKRCHPMSLPGEAPSLVKKLVAWVEEHPDARVTEAALKDLGIDPSTARRQFQQRFQMTFSQYARARRLGIAAQKLTQGDSVISAQLDAGYQSASGFRKAYTERFGHAPQNASQTPLWIDWIDTPLGPMIAICDTGTLYLLEFTVRVKLEGQLERLRKTYNRAIVPGQTEITEQIRAELAGYFSGTLKTFKTPLTLSGTQFQRKVWRALQTIPYGTTWSYADLSKAVGKDRAFQAVGSANAANGLALIVPCHRVIAKDGGLGGYAGGLSIKRALLEQEALYARQGAAP